MIIQGTKVQKFIGYFNRDPRNFYQYLLAAKRVRTTAEAFGGPAKSHLRPRHITRCGDLSGSPHRRSQAGISKLHLRYGLRTFLGRKIGFLIEAEHAGDQVGRKRRIVTLYCRVASLKRVRATAIRFSVPSSWACSSRKFWLAFRSGYCSATAIRRPRADPPSAAPAGTRPASRASGPLHPV